MHYLTRHLEAQTEISHGDQLLRKGDRFRASDVDADYWLKHKKVIEVKADEAPKDEPEPEGSKPVTKQATARRTLTLPTMPQHRVDAQSLVMTSRDLPGPAQDIKPAA